MSERRTARVHVSLELLHQALRLPADAEIICMLDEPNDLLLGRATLLIRHPDLPAVPECAESPWALLEYEKDQFKALRLK